MGVCDFLHTNKYRTGNLKKSGPTNFAANNIDDETIIVFKSMPSNKRPDANVQKTSRPELTWEEGRTEKKNIETCRHIMINNLIWMIFCDSLHVMIKRFTCCQHSIKYSPVLLRKNRPSIKLPVYLIFIYV